MGANLNMKSFVAALACIASASAAVIPAAYNGYAYPYSYGYTAAQPVATIAAASPVTYAAQPVAYAAAPVAYAHAPVVNYATATYAAAAPVAYTGYNYGFAPAPY